MRLATRGSALARAQAELVAAALREAESGLEVEVVIVKTADGALGDKGRFVKELEHALLEDRADLAVHSAKDVPGELPDGLAIVGVPERADPRDALCGAASLDALADGATVGTASLRRRSQLLAARPDLDVRDLRGNVDTRLGKLAGGDFDAIVLAAAGLLRLDRVGEGSPVDVEALLPAAGQGCLALEARAGDERALLLAGSITDASALTCLTAERAVVRALDADCRTPVAAHAVLDADTLRMTAYAGRPDGSAWVRDSLSGPAADPAALGVAVGERMLAAGAAELLAGAARND